MKPVDLFFPFVCQFCLTVIHFSSCLFVTFKGKCLELQIGRSNESQYSLCGMTNSLIRSSDWRKTVLLKAKTSSPALRSLQLLLKWHQKRFSTCMQQPTESTEVILGGARAFFFCCKHDHHFRKKQKQTGIIKHMKAITIFFCLFFFCLSSFPNDSHRNWTTENFTKVHVSI